MAPIASAPPPAVVHLLHAESSAWKTYQVKRGDTLTEIARAHHTTVQALAKRNKLADPNRLLAGQRLEVPSEHAASKPHTAAKPAAKKSGPATKKPADKKAKPAPKKAAKAPARALVSYVARRGDSLYSIAQQHHTTVAALVKANKMSNPRRLLAGQRIQIPTAPPKHSAAAPAPKSPATSLSIAERTFLGRTYPEALVRKAAEHRRHLASHPVPTRSQTRAMIVATAKRYGVDPRVALAIGWQESGWNQRAVSISDAIGVMQVVPASGKWAESMGGRRLDLLNTQDNITAGVLVLRYNLTHATSLDQGIAGYYQGLAGVKKQGMYPDTKNYVRAVRAHMTRF